MYIAKFICKEIKKPVHVTKHDSLCNNLVKWIAFTLARIFVYVCSCAIYRNTENLDAFSQGVLFSNIFSIRFSIFIKKDVSK